MLCTYTPTVIPTAMMPMKKEMVRTNMKKSFMLEAR